jgi:hypothetical protein
MLCFVGFSSAPAFAGIDINKLSYAGSGCPGDGVGIRPIISNYSKRLIVYMPDMKVDRNGGSLARKVCSLALPVQVSANERVVIGWPSIFGKRSLADGEKLEAFSEVFFAGGSGPRVVEDFEGHGDRRRRDFYSVNRGFVVSECGRDVIVRTRSVIMASQGTARTSGEAELRGTALDVRIEPCGN